MSDQRITVSVRIRPPLGKERYESLCARKADDDQTIVIKPEENASNMGEAVSFQFDNVFDENDQQRDVYTESVQELVDHALSGFNATVFTYGQTGSGKTFTILGNMSPDGSLAEDSGMFLRVFHDLFSYKETVGKKMHIIITLSALELYVDDVMDLLANKNKLKLRETPEETLTMGIRTVEVTTMADVVRNFEVANSFRSVTATKMNDVSSRSHALFFIDLLQIPVEGCPDTPPLDSLIGATGSPVANAAPGLVRSRIALVDLAGSERVKRSGVTGQGMTEAQAINKSLSTLGTVINAMYIQSPHIPFRESKLTKLLKNSLVDTTSRLLLIGQVAPPTISAQESLSTLRFCDRVKGLRAGQVMGFADPEEEERYLQSLRLNEELTAEMRILGAAYYYTPCNLRALAAEKGTSLEAEGQRLAQELQASSADLEARKEQEALAKMEQEAAAERDSEVEKFVLHMNALIEEYETVAGAAKKEKRGLKRLAEEQDADCEAKVQEAKRAKKQRVKAEEQRAELQAQVDALRQQESQVGEQLANVNNFDDDDDADASPSAGGVPGASAADDMGDSAITAPMEEATHRLVESFHGHCKEMSQLFSLYTTRLSQTGRQRTLVRRQKLLSSSLVTDGSLLYDIIAFLVDRAVDIAEGDLPMKARWGWHDVDGLSRELLNADQLYPPLIENKEENVLNRHLAKARIPGREEHHKITFLSSDESDDENSHHAAVTRRQRRIVVRNGMQVELSSSEDDGSGTNDHDDGASDHSNGHPNGGDGASTPIPMAANWLGEAVEGDSAARDDEAAAAEEERRARKERKHKRRAAEAAAQAEAAAEGHNGDVMADDEHGNAAADAAPAKERRRSHRKASLRAEEGLEGSSAEAAVEAAAGEEGDGAHEDNGDAPAGEDGERKKKKRKSKKDRSHEADTSAAVAEGVEVGEEEAAAAAAEHDGDGDAASAEAQAADDPTVAYGPDGELLPRPRKLTKDEIDQLYIMKVYDSPKLIQDLLKFLRCGSVMLKHGRHGKPHDRFFWINITKGKRELLWREPNNEKASPSVINLDDVSYIQLGCFSKVFKRKPIYPHDPSFFRCFTIGLKGGGRTVDCVAATIPDYEAWVVGLSHLVAIDPAWGGKLDVTKEPGYERLNYFESVLCEQNYLYPSSYLALKKTVQHIAKRTMEALEEAGNDKRKAFAVLGGIHLPGINDKGAVYLTKGELRNLCPELRMDIFRTTHIWLHFQQTNLVYDDYFIPATPFGVTRRE